MLVCVHEPATQYTSCLRSQFTKFYISSSGHTNKTRALFDQFLHIYESIHGVFINHIFSRVLMQKSIDKVVKDIFNEIL